MYNWLDGALRDSSHVVTASRRLARTLQTEYGLRQLAAGHAVWRRPPILSWQDWLTAILAGTQDPEAIPTRISAQQSQLLWERCLRREITDPLLNIAMLARQVRETWARLHDWSVSLDECERLARGSDQRLFVRVARQYQSMLDQQRWVDDAGLPAIITQVVRDERVDLPRRLTFAGFDRINARIEAFINDLKNVGCAVQEASLKTIVQRNTLLPFENRDAELRAAGNWARQQLDDAPDLRIAVVVSNLEQDAPRCARLVREGLVPGWQNAASRHANTVNVSYGRKLAAYPAVAIALLVLRWLCRDLNTEEIGLLLRSGLLGEDAADGRVRLELQLRRLPDRQWSAKRLLAELQDCDDSADAIDWLDRVKVLHDRGANLPRRASPSAWAVCFDESLRDLNWPGSASLKSAEFQLVNRWRELLNELARLALVMPSMTAREALGRLTTLANEIVFQPESEGAVVQLMGPLEAAGMQFDRLWIAGLSAANWPPVSRPLALVSRDLQRQAGMPDAEPQDTLAYARRVIARLSSCAAEIVCSYPRTDGDTEQTVTPLLAACKDRRFTRWADPGWNASNLVNAGSIVESRHDPVPAVADDEIVGGGAATIEQHLREPFTAFVLGRLGVRTLATITRGLTASLRGTLIHNALHRLYAELPTSQDIAAWSEDEVAMRVDSALRGAFWPQRRHADPVLDRLLLLEQRRVGELLKGVIAFDCDRHAFSIASVEDTLEFRFCGIRLRLRCDRIDRVASGELQILDYKTGAAKRLLNRSGDPDDMQLVVYASALSEPVADIALFNIDSRAIEIDGAGRTLSPQLDWDRALPDWIEQVKTAAIEIAVGDVRVDVLQSIQSSRPLGLLSRFTEFRDDA